MAATNRSFSSMLNEYLPFDLLREETIKRNYILQNIQKDNNWKGGNLVVPFKGGNASSFSYGQLTALADVAEDKFVRGNVATYKEIWGTMKFNAKDLAEHGSLEGQASGMVSEQSFLKILPETLDDFLDAKKQVVSVNLLTGPHFATLTADATVNDGKIVVDHPERFTIGQKVIVQDSVNSTVGYVTGAGGGIDLNTKTITLDDARTAGTVLDFSAAGITVTVANGAKTYVDGAETAGQPFTSMGDQLLSAANGGSAALFGETKVDYPYLQATNVDGSAIDATNILDGIFDAWTEVQKLGRGPGRQDCIMSYKNLGSIMKLLQQESGPFRHVKTKADLYGWTELTIVGVRGELKIVGVHEMDDDKIFFVDWSGWKLCSNGLFRMQRDPEGKMYFTQRATSGYEYYVDCVMFGEQICYKPSHQGVIHTISYA